MHPCKYGHPNNLPIPGKCGDVTRTILGTWEGEHSLETLLLTLALKAPHTLASISLPRFLLMLLFMQPAFNGS